MGGICSDDLDKIDVSDEAFATASPENEPSEGAINGLGESGCE